MNRNKVDAVRYRWLRKKLSEGLETYIGEWVGSGKELDEYIDLKLIEDSQMNVENMGHMDEYLLRTCKRCGFQWAEECFNSNEGGE